MSQTEVFTTKTLSDRWSCSENTIRNMIKNGKLKAFKVGGVLLRIKLDEVLRWEQESAGENTRSEDTTSGGIGVVRSLTGSMRAGKDTKQNSAQQTKALQELHLINSRVKQS